MSPASLRRLSASSVARSGRRLKMARLLYDGDLLEESQAPLLESMLLLSRAFTVENRIPEPADLKDTFVAPLSACWKGSLPVVQQVASGQSPPSSEIFTLLEGLLARGHTASAIPG